MGVVETYEVIQGLLEEELQRCLSAIQALDARLASFPKGSLNVRKKVQQGEYTYHYLVYREDGRVMNRHIPIAELPALRKQLVERDKCQREARAYKGRVAYIEKLLGSPRGKMVHAKAK